MHVLMLVVNGIAGINLEHPITQRLLLSLQLEIELTGRCYHEINVDTFTDNNYGHLNLEPVHNILVVNK